MSALLSADFSANVNSSTPAAPSKEHYFSLTESARKILWKVYSLSRRRGYSFARMETLAQYVGLSERQVRKIVNALVESGWLGKVRRRYCVHLTLLHPLPSENEPMPPSEPIYPSQKFRSIQTIKNITIRLQQSTPLAQASPPAAPSALVVQLIENGISESTARQLAASHDESLIRDQLEALPFRQVAQNAAGLLVASIRRAFSLPAALIERRERAQKHQREQAQRRLLAEKERQEQEERARRDAWLAALPPGERLALEERLIARLVASSPTLARSREMGGHAWRATLQSALRGCAPPLPD